MNEQSKTHRAQTHSTDGTSSVGLVTQLTREMTELFSKEVALAKSEVSHSVKSAKAGVAGVATGGLVLYAGFLMLLWAAVLGLSEFVQPWLAAVIVGGVVAIIGLTMLQSSKKKLEPENFKPTHTARSLHKDRDAMRGATT